MKPRLRDKWKVIGKASDGCTNSPDFNFTRCCEEHDYHYSRHDITRAEADKILRKCIQRKWKGILLPWIYWGAVRIFGRRHW